MSDKAQSWVLVELSTGKAIYETWSEAIADKVNTDKYKAVPIMEYLQGLNQTEYR